MTGSNIPLFEFTFTAMGAPCEFKFYCESSDNAQAIYTQMLAEVRRLEQKYSRYDASSLTSKINASAGSGRPLPIDNECAALLNYAEELHRQSDGLFDITSGVLRQAWDFKSGKLPTQNRLDTLIQFIDWPAVVHDDSEVYLPKAGMELDFGGFVKEFATDIVAVKGLDLGLRHGIINLGGDIRILGPHPDESPWRVGIQHPRISKRAIAYVDVFQGAIATSGDYERFMLVKDKRYCHLLNPKTGQSLQPRFSSVSVMADSCLIAGSFSTITMLKSHSEPTWLIDAGVPYLLIDQHLKLSGSLATSHD